MKRLKPFRLQTKGRKPSRRAFLEIYQTLFHHYGRRHWWPAETPFEMMVGAILTQSTSWRNVEKAIDHLSLRKKLSFKAVRKISRSSLARLIKTAGYFNIKADRLKNLVNYLWDVYRGNLKQMFLKNPHLLRKELLEVKGIGEETADSILLYAAKKKIFVVDTYTRRVFSRHGFIQGDESYSAIQKIITDHLPLDLQLFNDYHAQIVEVGKDYCRRTPNCSECPLNRLL